MEGVRTLMAAFVAVAALLAVSCAGMSVRAYRAHFVASVGSSLKRNFILADAHSVFLLTAAATLVLTAIGFIVVGPPGAVAGLIIGVAGPRLALRTLIKRRIGRFVYQLPDALLALASALRAGSNLTKGLELLATRQPAPLSQEFTIVLAEYRIGKPLAESLADLRRRVDAPELDLVNTAVNVSRRVGGNLADTLEALARTLQEKAHIEGKIDALTSMGRAQGWVVGLLPVFIGLVLYQQQPERMSLLFTEWYGWIVLAIVALMMTVAAWMIRKIVRIDV